MGSEMCIRDSAEMAHVFFMGRLRKGSWHEGPKQHLVGLLGSLWYNMSQSDVFNTTQKPYKHVIHGAFDIVWDGKFDKPTETRSMVTWLAAMVLEGCLYSSSNTSGQVHLVYCPHRSGIYEYCRRVASLGPTLFSPRTFGCCPIDGTLREVCICKHMVCWSCFVQTRE